MRYPLAASSGVKRVRGDNDGEERVGGEWEVELRGAGEEGDGGSGGVLLWNLVEGQVVRRVNVKHLVTLAMDQR